MFIFIFAHTSVLMSVMAKNFQHLCIYYMCTCLNICLSTLIIYTDLFIDACVCTCTIAVGNA